jgi:hypothetical protein
VQTRRAAKSNLVLPLILAIPILGVGLGVLGIGLKKGGFLTTTDVGGLDALGPIQARLMALNICEMQHATRDKRGNRTHRETIFVTPCSTARAYERVVIKVPQRAVHYEMKRSSSADRFKILVEKDDVVFDDLVSALGEHASILENTYQRQLDQDRAMDANYQRGVDEARKAEQERKERAKGSFPAK